MSATAINNRDEWQAISRDEQREVLQEGLQQELGDEPGVGEVPRWDTVDEVTQEQTLAAIEGALDESWTARAFEDSPKQTVPFEMRQLTEAQQDDVLEWVQVFAALHGADAESVDELRDQMDNADEVIEKLDDFNSWANGFLAEITVGDRFDAAWWASGDAPSGTRLELFEGVLERYEGQISGSKSFRGE